MNNGILTNDLILRTVTENDIKEIARIWEYPQETTIDKVYEAPNVIIGWCRLDGEAEIGKTVFYMIDEKYRNRGYATQWAIEFKT